MSLVPYVIEQTDHGERSYNICSRLPRERTIFPGEEVSSMFAGLVVAQFLFLESEDPGKDTHLHINSPGGFVSAGFTIYNTMNYIECDVSTICTSMAASMSMFLLSGGAKGKRFTLPNVEIMIHQPSGGAKGQTTKIKIVTENTLKTREELNGILAVNTGKPLEVAERGTERGNYMFTLEAKEYGLIDEIITHRQCYDPALGHQAGNVKQQVKGMKDQVSYANETR